MAKESPNRFLVRIQVASALKCNNKKSRFYAQGQLIGEDSYFNRLAKAFRNVHPQLSTYSTDIVHIMILINNENLIRVRVNSLWQHAQQSLAKSSIRLYLNP